jgi:hypothetical protein
MGCIDEKMGRGEQMKRGGKVSSFNAKIKHGNANVFAGDCGAILRRI